MEYTYGKAISRGRQTGAIGRELRAVHRLKCWPKRNKAKRKQSESKSPKMGGVQYVDMWPSSLPPS